MNSIILCEGPSDAILLSYYLSKVFGWSYTRNSPRAGKGIIADSNQEANWYKRGEDFLLIYGVGGKDNYKNVMDKYVSQILMNYPPKDNFNNIVIITDKDDKTISDIELNHERILHPYAKTITNQKWQTNTYTDRFGYKQQINTLSIIIPTDKQGALETTLLEAISEDIYDKAIVEKCETFIQEVRVIADRYIKSDRLAIKAELSAVFSVLSPEKVLDSLKTILGNVPWEKSEVLRECFGVLGEI